MGSCDLCGASLGADAKHYSSTQMRSVVSAGLRPTGGPLDSMAAITGIPVDHSDWVGQVMSDSTDWAVCPDCAPKVDAHL